MTNYNSMNPQELSTYLKSVASYLEEAKTPSRKAIVAGLVRVSKSLNARQIKAGQITKLVDADYSDTMHGLESLIDRLGKAAKTLNPQNESKATLEHSVSELQSLKASLSEFFQNLSNIDL